MTIKTKTFEGPIEVARIAADNFINDSVISHLGVVSGHPSTLSKQGRYTIPKTPDEIDWSHVAPEYKFMSRDENGDVDLSTHAPNMGYSDWSFQPFAKIVNALAFTSYKRGTVDWQDSLVERPE